MWALELEKLIMFVLQQWNKGTSEHYFSFIFNFWQFNIFQYFINFLIHFFELNRFEHVFIMDIKPWTCLCKLIEFASKIEGVSNFYFLQTEYNFILMIQLIFLPNLTSLSNFLPKSPLKKLSLKGVKNIQLNIRNALCFSFSCI